MTALKICNARHKTGNRGSRMIILEYRQDALEEWIMIETQGHIEVGEELVDGGAIESLVKLGKLTMDGDGRATLAIGNHLLQGRLITLKKPLLLLKKQQEEGDTRYVSRSIIKKKILFKNRPSILKK